MKLKTFKARASGVGNLMGIKGLGETGYGYIETWVKEQFYSRRKMFSNKYTKKGITKEDDTIAFVAEYLGYKGVKKNTEQFEDEHFTGEPDIIYKDEVIDVKTSWDCFTFPFFQKLFIWVTTTVKEYKTKEDVVTTRTHYYDENYYAQAQVYMHLTGKKKYKLIYALMDTPEELIDKEFRFNNPEELTREEHRKDYQYEHLPAEQRIKIFEFEYDPEYVAKMIERVEEAREYIKNELL